MSDPTVRTTRRRVAVAAAGTAAASVTAVAVLWAPHGDVGHGISVLWTLVFGGFLVLSTTDRTSPRQRQKAATAWTLVPIVAWLAAMERFPDAPAWRWAMSVLPAVALVYAVGHLAAGPDARRPATGVPPPGAARILLAASERVVWTRTVVSRRGLVGVAILLAAAAVQVVVWINDGALTVAAMLLAAAIWSLLSAYARVRVDGSGVRVEQPLLRRALVTAPMEEIRVARAVPLDPTRLGWNEYGVLSSTGLAGYRATRSGETLALDLTGGREFLVTVPDAGTAAGLLNAEPDRQRSDDPDRTC
ncbi:hypothetical protein [Pseudonocardia sp. KRD291]|uniref:hypothetical protein n=1 Tax=Pseudonocardia sp. KRD291 TaxID=2792007 RepID=UPI001C4A293A|nr:hypothetical protein [Pseudonocardia sp. KRD291]MBW0104561.1 hypothetical protein [Pseudonocardia sp. KRD291]